MSYALLAILREKAGDGSTDFFVEVRQSDLAALISAVDERDGLLSQRWSHQNRAEVAERGHKASQARDFEQRDQIAALRAGIEHVIIDSPGTPETVKGYLRKLLRTRDSGAHPDSGRLVAREGQGET